ncbi:MAG TPA: hypothetical protein VHR17_12115 [Thermoanaerobaculia bacterium]|jgi:hypothetical protein|nr:hypothetical protein [Thermoanaerobaculia bacterium]
MTARLNWFGAAFGFMLLLLVSVAVVSAQQEGAKPAAAQETLTGTLSGDATKGWTLVEDESGDSIKLKGSVKFADHVGHKVAVTGKWSDDGKGNKYFEVAKLEMAPTAPAPKP